MAEEEEAGGEERPSMAQFSALTTYSDLITLMASFFLLMFMIALQEQSKAKATMETVMEAVARQLNHQPRGTGMRPSGGSPGAGGPEEGEKRRGPRGKSVEVRSLTDDERQKLSFGDRLLFKPGSAALTTKEQRILQSEVAPEMRGFSNRIEIRGHTAGIADEGDVDLWKLGYDRAHAVMRYLVDECGMEANRFQLTSFADGQSLRHSDPETDRRVEIIMSDLRVDSHSGQ